MDLKKILQRKWEGDFYPHEDNPKRGDYIKKVVDPRQTYWRAVPGDAPEENK